jgi:hypothetical protein
MDNDFVGDLANELGLDFSDGDIANIANSVKQGEKKEGDAKKEGDKKPDGEEEKKN